MIKLYNTLTAKKENFSTIDGSARVKMYTCGITPYDSPHLGHLVTSLRANVIRRYLTYRGYEVTFVQNVTDVEDKIINRSRELKISPRALSEKFNTEYEVALQRLGITLADSSPKVTDFIPQIVRYIEELIASNHAYTASTGDVYFDIKTVESYGKLSKRKVADLLEGTRHEIREEKRNPLDFALWKAGNDEGASYDSPWGRGRPGWHIECSVMANEILGPQIDIHCGGLDLLFPHHENEIVQCEAHNGSPFARFWLHTGLLNINGTKMSKSLGNFITAEEGISKYGAVLITFVTMKFHYRSPINFSDELFDEVLNQVADYYWLLEQYPQSEKITNGSYDSVKTLETEFATAMDNDLNNPVAMVALANGFKKLRALQKSEDESGEGQALAEKLRKLGQILFLFQENSSYEAVANELLHYRALTRGLTDLPLRELGTMLGERRTARENKEFAAADAVRERLEKAGITVLDGDKKGWRFS